MGWSFFFGHGRRDEVPKGVPRLSIVSVSTVDSIASGSVTYNEAAAAGGYVRIVPTPPSPNHPSIVTRAFDEQRPRRFVLDRMRDASGISGTGWVATGCVFPDGSVAMRWNSATPSTAVYDNIDALEKVHSHGGWTRVVWLDEQSDG